MSSLTVARGIVMGSPAELWKFTRNVARSVETLTTWNIV